MVIFISTTQLKSSLPVLVIQCHAQEIMSFDVDASLSHRLLRGDDGPRADRGAVVVLIVVCLLFCVIWCVSDVEMPAIFRLLLTDFV